MARCLNPITIKNPSREVSTRFYVYEASSRYARDNIINRAYREIVVPCGKCLNCLKNRQSSMVVRCKREAEQRGSFAFMTLTYDDDHLPLTRSLWRVSRETGEMEIFERPEFLSTGVHPDPDRNTLFKQITPGVLPRYHDIPLEVPDPDFSYIVRVTPSVCRSDVQSWLKMARIQYERDFGEKLPDFSYVAISEYGPRTCRPHYHLAFFGLQRPHLDFLLSRWNYGLVKQVRIVSQINRDGSNGFLRASKYIGKYMSKGKFECESVKDCCAERPRVCQSRHLGTKELEPVRRQLLCFDMVGEYDPETLRYISSWEKCVVSNPLSKDFGKEYLHPVLGDFLPRFEVDRIVDEIPRRLIYRVDDKTVLPIPRIIRDKIFKNVVSDDDPKKKVSSTLWCMVTSSLRDKFARDGEQQFAEFCALHPEREMFENISLFAYWQSFCADVEEEVNEKSFRSFYGKSHF